MTNNTESIRNLWNAPEGEWERPDSVYNAWLLSNNSRRKWFPYKLFAKIYPYWEEKKNQLFEEDENRVEFSFENQSSLLSSVDIDDKNNCRPSSSKSENKPIVLDNSEQDLDSSYRDTQDSDTEDASSTNASASDQSLFISLSESDSENSDIDIARSEKKKEKIEEESGSESEGMNIKLEQFLPSFGIKETIFISDDESKDETKSNLKKFVPVKKVEDFIILSDSD